jgi:hypothetical protein
MTFLASRGPEKLTFLAKPINLMKKVLIMHIHMNTMEVT